MISLDRVTKRFSNGITAVDDVSLEVNRGETFVLIGTSGCGKTTTMKLINRLVDLTSGSIRIMGTDIKHMDIYSLRRSIGYVIQSIGLFPHFSIERNIGVVPELSGWSKEETRARVYELLELVGLDPDRFASCFPDQLSGGQQQRVGVARALAADPEIILMDEPFGALDPLTRETLQKELSPIWNELDKTVVFVTHDIFEAVKLGDRMGVMDSGKIVQVGTPAEVIKQPENDLVASFFSHHRFQLDLLTASIRSFIQRGEDKIIQLTENSITLDQLKKYVNQIDAIPRPCVDANGRWFGLLSADLKSKPDYELEKWLEEGRTRLPTLLPNDSLIDAIDALKNSPYPIVPVVDTRYRFLGIVEKETITREIVKIIE